jgi:hypothetical protein
MKSVLWLFLGAFSFSLAAQEFAPPPPPPLDEYEEFDGDGFEDETFSPPSPPPLPPGNQDNAAAAPPPPPPDYRSSNSAYISQPGKFRFKIVEGEFWEKGKKRSRGKQMYGRSSGN